MIKLLYITNGIDGSGGLERVLSIKASCLAEQYNYDITILCLNELKEPFYDFSTKIKFESIEVSGNSLSYFLKYRKGIKNIVKNIKPDVISVCDDGLKGFLLPLILGKNIPIIYERHASINLNFKKENVSNIANLKNKLQFKIMRYAATKFDRFVVLTSSNLTEWKSGNLLVIPNPLSFYPKNLPQNKYRIKNVIAVGSHSYNKGYDLLLKSWQKVHKSFPDWNLIIYGKKDPEQIYITLANQMNLSSSVRFYDPVNDIEKAYHNATILVLPSRSEGFGMVLIEAMACGLPCVSYNCPHGPGDIITDGEDGFLIENGDTEQFADKLIELINAPNLLEKMGVKARKTSQQYIPKKVVEQWDFLFKSLIS